VAPLSRTYVWRYPDTLPVASEVTVPKERVEESLVAEPSDEQSPNPFRNTV
jgi:hypothetical protein